MVSRQDLRTAGIFKGLSDADVEMIANFSSERSFAAGDVMAKAGQPANQLYVLLSGEVEMITEKAGNKKPQVVSDLTAVGEVIGWSSLVEPHVYTFTVVAKRDVNAIAIDGLGLRDWMDTNSSFGLKVMKGIAKVIRARLPQGFVS